MERKRKNMKYQDIADNIYQLIKSGEGLGDENQLLSERKLAERFGCSRATVRKALDLLSKRGLLHRHHGKGTFTKDITDGQTSLSIYSIVSCAQYYQERGLHATVKVLDQKIIPANDSVSDYLQVEKGTPVLMIKKLYRANRTILNESISYLRTDIFPNVDRFDFSNPIIEVLKAQYHVKPVKTSNTVEAVLPSLEVAENLKLGNGTPVILFESITHGYLDEQYVPLEYYRTYQCTNELRLSFEQEYN